MMLPAFWMRLAQQCYVPAERVYLPAVLTAW